MLRLKWTLSMTALCWYCKHNKIFWRVHKPEVALLLHSHPCVKCGSQRTETGSAFCLVWMKFSVSWHFQSIWASSIGYWSVQRHLLEIKWSLLNFSGKIMVFLLMLMKLLTPELGGKYFWAVWTIALPWHDWPGEFKLFVQTRELTLSCWADSHLQSKSSNIGSHCPQRKLNVLCRCRIHVVDIGKLGIQPSMHIWWVKFI